ncbi:efflux RND transporter periplasmic adaptor subunit [Dyella halodurans]|uniref:Efflux RND transporter periplasmic adaptor subunit n=1 Tax=Dyella halodurans TaxID=1920171 RepID=A0ABV9C3G0_9GAMM|nr:efflux RND transporter periplasmic adaptor subunit [Dyella halodurans]
MKRKNKTRLIIGVVVVLGGGGLLLMHVSRTHAAVAAVAPPPVEADVATVLNRKVTEWQSYSGRLQAVDHVEIHALVPGTIEAIYFRDGQQVKKGDPLFLIDPRPYQASLDQALADVQSAKASEKFAQDDFERAKKLIANNAMSRRDYDEKADDLASAAAKRKAAEAAAERARVNLEYTHITAPVSGRMSRTEFTVGNIVSAGTSSPALTSLVSISPIYAEFDVDEQTYLGFIAHREGRDIEVRLGLANETGYSRLGKLFFVDNQLSAASGTIRVRAIFENLDGALVPGLFARVQVQGGLPHPAVLIDEKSISTDQARKFVYVVDAGNHAQYRAIVPGAESAGLRQVVSGLQPGERIVVSGFQRIHPGDEIRPKDVPMAGESSTD